MKKYLIIFALFIIALISIDNAYATSNNGWGYDKKHPYNAFIYDCSSSSCSTDLSAMSGYIDDSNSYYYSGSSTNMPVNSPGVMWAFVPDVPLKSNYLYSVTTYVCHNVDSNLVFESSYAHNSISSLKNFSNPVTSYYSGAFTNLATNPFDYTSTHAKCGALLSIFKPNVNATYYGVRYSLSSSKNSYTSALIGYEIQSLGVATQLTQADIESAISGSGLASASDISSVNSSLTNIQSQLSSAETNIINEIDSGLSDLSDEISDRSAEIQQNQDENTDRQIESQEVCNIYDKVNIFYDGKYLNVNNGEPTSVNWGITSYLPVTDKDKIQVLSTITTTGVYLCFYGINKNKISCIEESTISDDSFLTIPSNTSYMRFSINKLINKPQLKICKNGNQAINEGLNNLNDTMNNNDVSGANSDATGFFNGFSSSNFGLSSIITMPLQFISHLTDNNTCNSLILPLPFVNTNATLPCMTPIYNTYFHDFLVLYQTITTGFISYWVCVNIFRIVRGFKNPESDQVEVMDL